MMMSNLESTIVYENGDFWVQADKKRGAYMVYRSGLTHSVSDGGYALSEDGLSLAKARADYLAKSAATYNAKRQNSAT